MFRGHHPTRVDEKGRLKLPADFKHVIDEKQYGARFYITSTDGKIAQVYPLKEWEQKEQQIKSLTAKDPSVKKYFKWTSYWGQEVEMDAQGRLLLPNLLREKANLKGELSVVGLLDHLEVQVHEDLRSEVEGSPFTPEDEAALAKLGIW
jgi:MraZ protein